jgi:antitoxin VapB
MLPSNQNSADESSEWTHNSEQPPDCLRSVAASCLEYSNLYIILIVALSIKDPEADRLARELAARTGETLTEAVVVALRERLARETGRTRSIPLREELAAIRRRCAALPVLDTRTADEILGYDERGLPV